mmetsp:Transcript_7444/g.11236  ORF Transcript_7444/g.11236 Transcript_7444/m.11236 type:complete len:280 (+) Transcript_7444:851-1690(+)
MSGRSGYAKNRLRNSRLPAIFSGRSPSLLSASTGSLSAESIVANRRRTARSAAFWSPIRAKAWPRPIDPIMMENMLLMAASNSTPTFTMSQPMYHHMRMNSAPVTTDPTALPMPLNRAAFSRPSPEDTSVASYLAARFFSIPSEATVRIPVMDVLRMPPAAIVLLSRLSALPRPMSTLVDTTLDTSVNGQIQMTSSPICQQKYMENITPMNSAVTASICAPHASPVALETITASWSRWEATRLGAFSARSNHPIFWQTAARNVRERSLRIRCSPTVPAP